MNKKKLLAMPIVAVVVAMLSIFVMAASPVTGVFEVHDKNDDDQSKEFVGVEIADPGINFSVVPGLVADIEAKGLKVSDFKYKIGYEVTQDPNSTYDIANGNPHTVYIKVNLAADEYAIVIHKSSVNGSFTFNIVTGPASKVSIGGINDFSPFYVYVGSKSSSPQTGDFAPVYIAMISVALISCGAIFAVRAKKASK